MHNDNFEKAFGDFLDRREYDKAQNALFIMVRKSFEAGWNAAGGDPSPPRKIYEFIHGKPDGQNDEPEE